VDADETGGGPGVEERSCMVLEFSLDISNGVAYRELGRLGTSLGERSSGAWRAPPPPSGSAILFRARLVAAATAVSSTSSSRSLALLPISATALPPVPRMTLLPCCWSYAGTKCG
jgi:hypothetical protein